MFFSQETYEKMEMHRKEEEEKKEVGRRKEEWVSGTEGGGAMGECEWRVLL